MRKLSANLILPVSSPPLKNGIITLDDTGRILDLADTGGRLREEPGLEFYNGVIVPGFILPWFVAGDIPLEKLDRELPRYGIKGIGLVLPGNKVSDGVFKHMSSSPVIYHPVIELCPGPEEDHFGAFNRGIDLVSRAFNEFHLSCSLTACSPAMEGDMGKFLREYASSHKNVSPPPKGAPENSLNISDRLQHPRKGIEQKISAFTLDAAAAIFEEDELGSIEPGKRPGLNLIGAKTGLKVLD